MTRNFTDNISKINKNKVIPNINEVTGKWDFYKLLKGE